MLHNMQGFLKKCALFGTVLCLLCLAGDRPLSTPDLLMTTATRLGRSVGRFIRMPSRALTWVESDRLLAAVSGKGSAGSPVSLTASDGTGLLLSSLKASAVVQGPLAFTELHLTFDNPAPRTIEGRFQITLPPGAAVSRFAMRMPDGWQEAEVVERQHARVAYEDFLHRRQDPALLEREAGNQFSARIFPIPAWGQKELIISYSQELVSSDSPYRLVLSGLPKLGRLEIVAIAGDEITQVVQVNVQPQQDFEVRPPPHTLASASGLRSDAVAVGRIRIPGSRQAESPISLDRLLILVDTSASRAMDFDKEVNLVAAIVEEIRKSTPSAMIEVAAFDQSVVPIYSGPISACGMLQLSDLRDRGALGASDLEGALRFAKGTKASRLILVTDGMATAAGGAAEQQAAARALAPQFQRMDVVMVGGIQDGLAMRSLAVSTLPQPGAVIDGAQSAAAVVQRLRLPVIRELQVKVPGASWYWPRTLEGVQPGDEVLVYAELGQTDEWLFHKNQSLDIHLLGTSGSVESVTQVPLYDTTGPLLARAFVQAVIASLSQSRESLLNADPKAASALQEEITKLSIEHRVLSDFTAMLVLEREVDYVRFQIDRRALVGIVTVGERGLEIQDRSHRQVIVEPAEPAAQDPWPWQVTTNSASSHVMQVHRTENAAHQPSLVERDRVPPDPAAEAMAGLLGSEAEDSYGGGGRGLLRASAGGSGIGQQTVGFGSLGMFGNDRASGSSYFDSRTLHHRSLSADFPKAVPGSVEIEGAMDRAVIRRVVRRQLPEVKACYDRVLVRWPNLRGRMLVRFSIVSSGTVVLAVVLGSTLHNPELEACIVKAIRSWQFPRTPLGLVSVSYPFVFRAPGDEDDAAPQPTAEETMQEVMNRLANGQRKAALAMVQRWRQRAPGDVLMLTALGMVLAESGDLPEAERAYGSIIDLFPSRADLRRYAGARLEKTSASGLRLAADSYKKAVEQRPDHPSGHRLYAYSLLKLGKHEEAFFALHKGIGQRYPEGRFLGVMQILREDLGLVAAAWRKAVPSKATEIHSLINQMGIGWPTRPSLRFVLNWETDANDVDFHIHDGKGGHASFVDMELDSGGKLYADVTTGYGPECFAIQGPATAFPYRFEAHYYSRGPMGYGMGKLQIVSHDGTGGLHFEERPFVVMNDRAYVDLGSLQGPLK